MTAQEYRENGFLLSSLISQDIIDRAEEDIIEAYIKPINPSLETTSDIYKKTLMTLSFFLICKRNNVFSTNKGTKTKDNEFSKDSDPWNTIQNLALDCHMALLKLREHEGSNKDAKIIDICNLYFKTTYWTFTDC